MHWAASNGNIRRPSSYQNCSPGTHPTQPMRLPTPARSRCTYPRCTASEAQHWWKSSGPDNAASFLASNQSLRLLLHTIAACLMHRHIAQQPAGNVRTHTLSLSPSHSLESHSCRPLRSPVHSFRTRYLGGATHVSLAFTRHSDLQGTTGVP